MSPQDPRLSGARLVARGFGWSHPGRDEAVFTGLDLSIAPGEKVLLLGPSGAGKSTLLHAIAGVLEEEDEERVGSLLIDGVEPSQARGRVGLMQQDPEASIVMSRVADDLAFGPENLAVDPEEIPVRSAEALAAVGLDVPGDHPTSALSGGQKQRLGLAAILTMRPGLLLLDEPTANLDPEGVVEVRNAVIRAVNACGSTLLVVEHRVAVWAEHVDRILVLDATGHIRHDGPPEQVLTGARDELIQAGIWVPGYVPRTRAEREPVSVEPGPELLRADSLAVTRRSPSSRWTRARRHAVRRAPGPPSYEEIARVQSAGGLAPSSHGVLDRLLGRDAKEPVWARSGPVAAEEIDVVIRAGEHLAVTGPNGAGKSTVALTLAGLLYPVTGLVVASPTLRGPAAGKRFPHWASQSERARSERPHNGAVRNPDESRTLSQTAGQAVLWDPMSWDSRELIRRLGTVFQEPEQQFLRSSVREELMVGPRLAGHPDPEARAEEIMERLMLTRLAEANPFTLSGGEKRRLSVGTALAADPAILVLDEPTFGQDARTWAQLVDLVRELLGQGTAVVSVTHDRDFIDALGGAELRVHPAKHSVSARVSTEDSENHDARNGEAEKAVESEAV